MRIYIAYYGGWAQRFTYTPSSLRPAELKVLDILHNVQYIIRSHAGGSVARGIQANGHAMTRGLPVALLILFVVAPPSGLRRVSALAVPAQPQRFEVSSVTACPPVTVAQTGTEFTLSPVRPVGLRIERTRLTVLCQTVASVIHMAYNGGHYGHVNAAGRDVVGGPSWIRSELYTIEGSADGVERPDLTGAMMRSLLEDRFQLRVRRHADDAPMYALKVARGGLKIKPLAPTDCVVAPGVAPSVPPPTPAGAQVPCGTFKGSRKGAVRVWDAVPATLKTIASLFDLDRHVIDKTGVNDRFAIHLELDGDPSGAPAAAVVKAFEEQLGLTLVSTKGRRSWVQIEQIERPILR